MKKKILTLLATLTATLAMSMTAFAAEPVEAFVTADVDMILYTTPDAAILTQPSLAKEYELIDAVALPDAIPVVVTGITSNGYFRVDLGTTVQYYVAGIGLTVDATAVTTPATNETTNTATPTVNTGKKYTFVTGTAEEAWAIENRARPLYLDADKCRKDYTNDALYINLRDQLEAQIANGVTAPAVKWTGKWNEVSNMRYNLLVDMLIDYPQYRTLGSATCAGYTDSHIIGNNYIDNGTMEATIAIRLSTNPYDAYKVMDL